MILSGSRFGGASRLVLWGRIHRSRSHPGNHAHPIPWPINLSPDWWPSRLPRTGSVNVFRKTVKLVNPRISPRGISHSITIQSPFTGLPNFPWNLRLLEKKTSYLLIFAGTGPVLDQGAQGAQGAPCAFRGGRICGASAAGSRRPRKPTPWSCRSEGRKVLCLPQKWGFKQQPWEFKPF